MKRYRRIKETEKYCRLLRSALRHYHNHKECFTGYYQNKITIYSGCKGKTMTIDHLKKLLEWNLSRIRDFKNEVE